MIKTAKGGAIVNISSKSAGLAAARPDHLHDLEGRGDGLTQAMAVDKAKRRPGQLHCRGPMYTPMVYAHGKGMSEAARPERANASVLKTEGTGWDVGHAVKFLLHDGARYIAGQALVVDGGVTLQGPERETADASWSRFQSRWRSIYRSFAQSLPAPRLCTVPKFQLRTRLARAAFIHLHLAGRKES